MRKVYSGGGWPAIRYALSMARQSGGLLRFVRALNSPNCCKTCALGMGGQQGGMVDESGHFPEVCKKSMQAMAADMQGRIDDRFFATYGFERLRGFSPRELEHMGRLARPVFAGAGDTHYRPIGWDEALAWCHRRLQETAPDENFFYVSGRSSNEAGFLLQLFARCYGTNNINNCSYYCHQASGVGLKSAIGTGTATIQLEDLARCDLFVLIGGNPASNHPRLMRTLMQLRRRGGQVIVINPLREIGLVNFSVPSDMRSLLFGSPIASFYAQPHIGGDIALLTGVAKHLDEIGAVDQAFVEGYTENWTPWRDQVRSTDWGTIAAGSGVDLATIRRIAELYASSERSVFAWTMGITHHLHGVENVQAIVNLALMRGMVGKPGAGLLPIRGHSNVQGIGSVGVTPALAKGFFDRFEEHFGVRLPTQTGLDTLACIDAAHAGKLRSGWCLGGNLCGATPDLRYTTGAIAKLDSICYFSTTLNTGHVHGRAKETLVLPMRARDEEAQSTTQESMFSFVRLSDGGPPRLDGPRGEVETIAAIAHGVLGEDGPIDWSRMGTHRHIRQAIAAVAEGYGQIGRIDESHREFRIEGRTFHEPRFATDTGKARFHVVPLPALPPADRTDGLTLMTIRSEGQFNTVVYEEHDLYRHQDRRDVILMNRSDIIRLGLREDDCVSVTSATGCLRCLRVRAIDIRAGNAAMYFPEANVLVPRDADPQSRTPAYKAVRVAVRLQERGVGDRMTKRLVALRTSE